MEGQDRKLRSTIKGGDEKMKKVNYDCPQNIEELLKSRRANPVATLELVKDMARRIKKLEVKR